MKKIFLLIYVLSLYKIVVAQHQTPEVTSFLFKPEIQTYEPKIRHNKLMLSTFELQFNSVMPIFAMGLQYERALLRNNKLSIAIHGKIGDRLWSSSNKNEILHFHSYGIKLFYNPFADKKIEYNLGLDVRYEYLDTRMKFAPKEIETLAAGINYMIMHRFIYNITPNLLLGAEAGIGLIKTYKNDFNHEDLNISIQLINLMFGVKF